VACFDVLNALGLFCRACIHFNRLNR
jgi:hypothetical protein